MPKSAIFIFLSLSSNKFSGFRSRWLQIVYHLVTYLFFSYFLLTSSPWQRMNLVRQCFTILNDDDNNPIRKWFVESIFVLLVLIVVLEKQDIRIILRLVHIPISGTFQKKKREVSDTLSVAMSTSVQNPLSLSLSLSLSLLRRKIVLSFLSFLQIRWVWEINNVE